MIQFYIRMHCFWWSFSFNKLKFLRWFFLVLNILVLNIHRPDYSACLIFLCWNFLCLKFRSPFLIIAAMTIPVSSTTCERTFSEMKLIKTTTRNTMSDTRLSDLCVLTVERDFSINFEQLIDNFADSHKNSRILLK